MSVIDAEVLLWDAYSNSEIVIEGNLLEANRMHEGIVRMGENRIDVEES